MSIWLETPYSRVAISDSTLFGVFDLLRKEYQLRSTSSGDTLAEMNKLGWGLIAPAALSKWSD